MKRARAERRFHVFAPGWHEWKYPPPFICLVCGRLVLSSEADPAQFGDAEMHAQAPNRCEAP